MTGPPPLGDADVPPEDDVEWNAPMTDDEVIEMLGPGTHRDPDGYWVKPRLVREAFDAGEDYEHVAERGNGQTSGEADEDTAAIAPDGYRLTDAGNAARLVDRCPGCFKYAHAWGRWLVYGDGVWAIDENDALITEQAKGVARGLFRLSAAPGLDKEEREKLFAAALRAESSGAIAAMVKLARGIPGIIVDTKTSTPTRTSSMSETGPSTYVLVSSTRMTPPISAPSKSKSITTPTHKRRCGKSA